MRPPPNPVADPPGPSPPVSTWTVTPLTAAFAAAATLAASALAGGAAHWAPTAKALAEEGIDGAARARALPTAVRGERGRREQMHGPAALALQTWPERRTLMSPLPLPLPLLPLSHHHQAKALALASVAIGGTAAVTLAGAQLAGLDLGLSGSGAAAELSPGGAAAAAESVRAAVRGAARKRILGEED